MKTKAAILWEPHTEWSVEEIELDPPKAGEVLVKLAASGMCHSDEHLVTGDMVLDARDRRAVGLQQFPIIGGHEGAGEVVEVGPGVTALEAGDHVVTRLHPVVRRVPVVLDAAARTCATSAPSCSPGRQVTDFTARHHAKDGSDLGIMCCLGTFSPSTRVVSEASLHQDRARTSRSTRPRSSAAASPPAGARPSTPPRCSPARPSSSSASAASA